jgi:two-component system sensor histidine kinase/response regulator
MADEIAPSSAAPTSSDEQYRPLFALSPQPGWVYDRDTLRFLEVNEAAVRSYGWTREEFLAMTIRDIRPPATQGALDTLLNETSESHRHSALSMHRTKAGRTLRVEISSYPLEFLGRAARMVLVQDVTERESAAEALALSEEKYRSVIEQLQDVFFRTDTAGHWTFLNQAWTTLTGNPVASSLGTHYLSYVHPSDRGNALDAIAPLTGGSAEKAMVEVRYFNSSGGYRWVEASTHVVRDDDGRVLGTMGTLRDVTERRAVNEERQRLETNIRQLLDASGEGIYGLDAHGVISFVNRRGSEMLGYTAEELIGQEMHALTHHSRPDGSPYPAAECPIHRAAVAGIPCEVSDEVMWRKDGRDMQVEYVASPVVEHGRLTGAVVNFRDITARKHVEFELIVARDAAESANRAKSDFLARMSHELRTPLNSIIGFANVLRKNRGSSMSDDQLSFANRIATNGRHLLALINDILDLSKIEAGRMTLDVSAVMLDTLVRETIDELEGETKNRPVTVRAEIPDVIRSIGTDAARVKQVLINLIGNSLKFTERGEVVVAIDADPVGVPLRIRVRDTGIGIPQDRLDAIFNVFEQAESMTSRRFGGTGLGLAISRSLCELMGHRLEVESVEGEGTTMLIQLGVAPRTARRSIPGIAAIPEPRPVTPESREENPEAPLVLIVDEDEDTALLLGQSLEEAGCRVARADSGVDALRMARDLLPDMIFLDLRLPKISGFDVFRILKSDDTLKDTPVVITSVAGSEARPGLAGAAAILDKPISRQQAIDLVRLWMPRTAS